ncbi:MAG TPA: hypothetical protein VFT74_03920 [Isosphaeraceae bacterium]|nr:hypothetical protein [Isosphaeraceae bacterium]
MSLVSLILLIVLPHLEEAPTPVVSEPPASLRDRLNLSPTYVKFLDVHGFPILGSAKVSDYAMKEAAYLVSNMLEGREDVLREMARNKTRLAVMASTEMTTDVPEHADLEPKAYWDRRARGLGATRRRPAVSCAEENLLRLKGDPYRTENILIHEFAHAILQMGLEPLDPDFGKRVRQTYRQAMDEGLWKGKYAATNYHEYWAEGVQSWFDTNRENDRDHNHVNTREELKEYDPRLAALIAEVFGDRTWRYVRPEDRAEPAHLEGFDRASAPGFAWPEGLEEQPRRTTRKIGEDDEIRKDSP